MSGDAFEVPQMGMQFLAEAEAEAAAAPPPASEASGQTESASDDVDAQAAELAQEAVKGKQTANGKPKNGATSQTQRPAAPKPAPEVFEAYEVDVNGKKYAVRSREQEKSLIRRGYAFMQRAEDINGLYENTRAQHERMEKDLGGYLEELWSRDPQKAADVAERLLLERAQLAELERTNPAAARAYQLQKELERRDGLERQRQQQAQQQEMQQLAQQQDEQLDRILDQTLTEANLPKTTPTVRTMGHLLRLSLQRGIELTPQELAHETREALNRTYGEYMDAMSDEALMDLLGPKRTERIRKALVSRVQKGAPRPDARPARRPAQAAQPDWNKADAKEKDDFEAEITRYKRQAAREAGKIFR